MLNRLSDFEYIVSALDRVLFMMNLMEHSRYLGSVRILSLNQVGEFVKYDPRSKSLVLGRKGAVFELYGLMDTENGLDDFRESPYINVALKLGDQYMGIDAQTGKAVLRTPGALDPSPEFIQFEYHRKRFDRSSASVAFRDSCGRRWLRHMNSTLRVCHSMHSIYYPLVRPRRKWHLLHERCFLPVSPI